MEIVLMLEIGLYIWETVYMIIKNYCADELVGLCARAKKTLVGKNKKTVDVGTIVI